MARKATSSLGIIATLQDKASGPLVKLSSSVKNAGDVVVKTNDRSAASMLKLAQTGVSLRMIEHAFRAVSNVVGGAINAVERWTKAAIAAEGSSSVFGQKMKALTAAQNEMAVAFGQSVTHSGAAREAIDALTTAAQSFAQVFRSEDFRTSMDEVFRALARGGANAINAFLGMKRLWVDVGTEWERFKARITGDSFVEPLEQQVSAADQALQDLADSLLGIGTAKATVATEIVGPNISETDLAKVQQQLEKERVARAAAIEKRKKAELEYLEWRDGAFAKMEQEMASFEAVERRRRQDAADKSQLQDVENWLAVHDEKTAATKRAAEQQKKALDETRATAESVGGTIVSSLSSAFQSLASGSQTAGEAFGSMFAGFGVMIAEYVASLGAAWVVEQGIMLAKQALGIETAAVVTGAAVAGKATESAVAVSTATTEIAAASAAGQAEAIAAHAGIPFAGIAIGLGVAAAIAALIGGLATNFATGGWVTGGVPGRDSVPAMLMPGEYVESVDEARSRRGGGPGLGPRGSSGSSGGGGGTTVINNNFGTLYPLSRAELERFHRDNVIPAQTRLGSRV